jgi:hypothetical protein
MQREIGERLERPVARTSQARWLRSEVLGMADVAPELAEQLVTVLSGRAKRIAQRVARGVDATGEVALHGSSVEAIECYEVLDVRRNERVGVRGCLPVLKNTVRLILGKLVRRAVDAGRLFGGKTSFAMPISTLLASAAKRY